jgi:hypothetical protein
MMYRIATLAAMAATSLVLGAAPAASGQSFTVTATATANAPADPLFPTSGMVTYQSNTNSGATNVGATAAASSYFGVNSESATAGTNVFQGFIDASGSSHTFRNQAGSTSDGTFTDTLTITSSVYSAGTPVNLVVTQRYTGTQTADIYDVAEGSDVGYSTQVLYTGSATDTAAGGQSITLSYSPPEAQISGNPFSGASVSVPISNTIVQSLPTAVGDTVALSVTEYAYSTANTGLGLTAGDASVNALDQIFLSTNTSGITFVSAAGALYAAPAPAALPLFAAGLSALTLRRRRAR